METKLGFRKNIFFLDVIEKEIRVKANAWRFLAKYQGDEEVLI